METKIITRVNDVCIISTTDRHTWIPINPVCEALGLDAKKEQDKIKGHPILSLFGEWKPLTGSDGKTSEMLCLPVKYIFGWLFTLNPDNMDRNSRRAFINFYDAIYRHQEDQAITRGIREAVEHL